MPLLNEATYMSYGATPVTAVYLGTEKVWPPTPTGPTVYAIGAPAYSTSVVTLPAGTCRVFGNTDVHRWLFSTQGPLSGPDIDWLNLPLGTRVVATGATSGTVADGTITTINTATGGRPRIFLNIAQVPGFVDGEHVTFEVTPP